MSASIDTAKLPNCTIEVRQIYGGTELFPGANWTCELFFNIQGTRRMFISPSLGELFPVVQKAIEQANFGK